MTEESLVNILNDAFSNMKVDENDEYSAPLFKMVIKNNIVVWTAVPSTPSILFYVSHSEYIEERSHNKAIIEVSIYIYNRHKSTGLDLEDILSKYITRVRREIYNLGKLDGNILTSNVISSSKDGGTILPYCVAELVAKIELLEDAC